MLSDLLEKAILEKPKSRDITTFNFSVADWTALNFDSMKKCEILIYSKQIVLTILLTGLLTLSVYSQDTVTNAFEGRVSDNTTGAAIAGASVQIENEETGVTYKLKINSKGLFFQGLLAPGFYIIKVSARRCFQIDRKRKLPSGNFRPNEKSNCEISVPVVAGQNEFSAYAFNEANVKSVDSVFFRY